MFATTPSFSIPVPRTLQEPETDYWAAFKLSGDAPWFLVTLAMQLADGVHNQTVGIAWEATLRNLVESTPNDRVLSIRRLDRGNRQPGAWRMHDISELWCPAPSEEEETGPVLMRVETETVLRDAHYRPVEPYVPGRTLLARMCA